MTSTRMGLKTVLTSLVATVAVAALLGQPTSQEQQQEPKQQQQQQQQLPSQFQQQQQQSASPPYALEIISTVSMLVAENNSTREPETRNSTHRIPNERDTEPATMELSHNDEMLLPEVRLQETLVELSSSSGSANSGRWMDSLERDMNPVFRVADGASVEELSQGGEPVSSVELASSGVESRASSTGDKNINTNRSSSNNNNNNSNNRPQARAREGDLGLLRVGGIVTPPPIRALLEVMPENYTARRIAEEANVFAIRLTNQLNIEKLGDKNLVLAPFSVYQGLVLLMAGSMGDTAHEMDRVLLGSSSAYANARLTHDPDRPRLLASLGEVVRRLDVASRVTISSDKAQMGLMQQSKAASDRSDANQNEPPRELRLELLDDADESSSSSAPEVANYIVANNLLFAPGSSEVSPEFQSTLAAFHNNTVLTEIQPGSTEAVHQVNNWIRTATSGLVPQLLERHSTFDEFNVMTLLCTAWMSHTWAVPFRRRTAALKTSIRLREGNKRSLGEDRPINRIPKHWRPSQDRQQLFPATRFGPQASHGHLMEFVDDRKQSHFVEYIQSASSDQIQHFSTALNGLRIELVVVPFRDSTHRLITITPSYPSNSSFSTSAPSASAFPNVAASISLSFDRGYHATGSGQPFQMGLNSSQLFPMLATANGAGSVNLGAHQHQPALLSSASDSPTPINNSPPVSTEPSPLSKLIAVLAANPRRAMRKMWNLIAPEVLTRQTLAALQSERHRNVTLGDTTIEASLPPPVRLSMPVLKNRADHQHHSLNAALNQIGLVNAFDRNQANFIAINGHPFNYHKLHLSQVIGQTSLNINERGLDFDPTISSLEPLRIFNTGNSNKNHPRQQQQQTSDRLELVDDVKLNKPFMYLICDTKTKLILFSGILRNPTAQERTE